MSVVKSRSLLATALALAATAVGATGATAAAPATIHLQGAVAVVDASGATLDRLTDPTLTAARATLESRRGVPTLVAPTWTIADAEGQHVVEADLGFDAFAVGTVTPTYRRVTIKRISPLTAALDNCPAWLGATACD